MGLKVVGMDSWRRDLETLPERAPDKLVPVMKRAGGNIKDDWKAGWLAISSLHGHIPHLIRSIGYDPIEVKGARYTLTVGVNPRNRQAFLAKIISYGTLTSAPHDAGQKALDAEVPRWLEYLAKVAQELLEGEK